MLARETTYLLDRAAGHLENEPRGAETWARAREGIAAAARLVAPMRAALLAMIDGLGIAEYRRFRKNFGRTSASESAALAEALFHRAPERLADAVAGALALAEGEALGAAIGRLPAQERALARATLEALDELHREVAAWLDTHMLLPVLHLGMARSLAGRVDAVTSNRLKRAETVGRGWFGRLRPLHEGQADPSAELDGADGYQRWRALRLGDLQLADAAHLADDEPAGRALDRLASELRRIERAERGAE